MALFANSLRCNGASAAEGRPTVAQGPSSRQPVTHSGPAPSLCAAMQLALGDCVGNV